MFDYISNTAPYFFLWGFLQPCFTEVNLYHLYHIFLSNVLCQHFAKFILSINGLFIVHFHSVEDFFLCCLVFISLFLKSHLHNYVFLFNINALVEIWPHKLKGINARLIHMFLFYNLFHHFHDNGCISITMSLHCDLNHGFSFFLNFFFLMILLRYLGAGAGAGAGAGVGADKNTFMKTDLALFVVFGLKHVTCEFLKKRRNYFNCSPKQDGPSLSGSHWSTNMNTRETEAYTGSCALSWYDFSTQFFSIHFCYMWQTQNYSFSWGFLHLRFPDLCPNHLYYIVLLDLLCHFVAHQHLPWADYSLQWSFHN